MKASSLLAILIIANLTLSQAQSIWKNGVIVTEKGDTIKGWVDYRNWEKNPVSIRFSGDPEFKNAVDYSIYQLRYLEVTGADKYVKAHVRKDNRPVKTGELLFDNRDVVTDETLFLRVLVTGKKFSLYEYIDSKPHFYFQRGTGSIDELTYKVALIKGNRATYNYYVQQLKNSVVDAPKSGPLLKHIESSRYTQNSLVNVVTEMNSAYGAQTYETKSDAGKFDVSPFIGVGYGMAMINPYPSASGAGVTDETFDFAPATFATIGVDFMSSRNLQAFGIRAEVSYMSAEIVGKKIIPSGPVTHSLTVKRSEISPTVMLIYNAVRKEHVRLFLSGGLSFNMAIDNQTVYKITGPGTTVQKDEKQYINMGNYSPSINVRTGVLFYNHVELALNWTLTMLHGQLKSNSSVDYGFNQHTYSAQLRYRF